ncbi:MAG: hypothetical protein HQL87_15030, partial [Magnetococcales bacterium]|nr:hypothetical protein [Magnetococcales bacterium]
MPPAPDLHCRLLNASNLAYAITTSGQWRQIEDVPPEYRDFYERAGFDEDYNAVMTFVANDELGKPIHACLIGYTQGELILAFRGTEGTLIDWLNDARFAPVSGETEMGGMVHSGFLDALKRLWAVDGNALPTEINERLNGKAFYITGHSKGGSLAFLALDVQVFSRLTGFSPVKQLFCSASGMASVLVVPNPCRPYASP